MVTDKKSSWTFVTNHTTVLLQIYKNPRITAREIAEHTNISERAIRKIIADLDREHYISKKREGRNVLYTVYADTKLRHSCLDEIELSELLKTLSNHGVKKEEKVPVLAGVKGSYPIHIYQATEKEQKSIDEIYSQLL